MSQLKLNSNVKLTLGGRGKCSVMNQCSLGQPLNCTTSPVVVFGSPLKKNISSVQQNYFKIR